MTRFFADKQTLDDLNIPGRHKNNSMARLFDTAVTTGGRKLMDTMFQAPLTDADAINKRTSIFKYFAGQATAFPFTEAEFSIMENYLSAGGGGHLLAVGTQAFSKKMLQLAAQDTAYAQWNAAVCQTIALLNRLRDFMQKLDDTGSPYHEERALIQRTFEDPRLHWLQAERGVQSLPFAKLVKYDHRLRTGMQAQLQQLTTLIFQLDVYIAVAGIAVKRGFSYAHALPAGGHVFTAKDLYHPALENAVGNTLSLDAHNNVLFLTGANMAGKSTLMKSFGISVYLAHMGFPVAAGHMEFSVKDGLYSSINVPDNLNMGYSHFYAEVLRVKAVAEAVAEGKDLVVIFDELFKGTNVKDAYDATLAITRAFSESRNCFFVISTHIIEVGEALKAQCDNFTFAYLPTVMQGVVPRYTYTLTNGITADRHGMIIIENEDILGIIRKGAGQPAKQ